MPGSRTIGLGISAESRLGNRPGLCKLVGATFRHRVHLTCSQHTPKKATSIRASIPNDRPCTVSRIYHEVGARADLPPGQHHRGAEGSGFAWSRRRRDDDRVFVRSVSISCSAPSKPHKRVSA
jgi:hypothetical protein